MTYEEHEKKNIHYNQNEQKEKTDPVKNEDLNVNGERITQLDENLLTEIKSIPSKMSFKIGEVSELLQVKPYVLRYWEMEFDFFHPKKTSNGQRLYFRKDVEVALLIKKLLYQDGFSIKGARQVFQKLKREKRVYHKKDVFQQQLCKEFESVVKTISRLRDLVN